MFSANYGLSLAAEYTIKTAASTPYLNFQTSCHKNDRSRFVSASIPQSSIPFKFDKVNSVERRGMTFMLFCKRLSKSGDYLARAQGAMITQDGEISVYNIGISEELHLNKNSGQYYFCGRPTHRLGGAADTFFRGCHVEFPIDIHYEFGSGPTLIAGYGIDYENRQHIDELNNAIRLFVETGMTDRP